MPELLVPPGVLLKLWEHDHERQSTSSDTNRGPSSPPRRLNFRVLVISMVLCVIAAGILYYAVYAHPGSEIGVPPAPGATSPNP